MKSQENFWQVDRLGQQLECLPSELDIEINLPVAESWQYGWQKACLGEKSGDLGGENEKSTRSTEDFLKIHRKLSSKRLL